ncbi:MAG: hypothetical protein RLZZ450_2026 [Pseudomonadota bacterium]|jgi:hypothetical protein
MSLDLEVLAERVTAVERHLARVAYKLPATPAELLPNSETHVGEHGAEEAVADRDPPRGAGAPVLGFGVLDAQQPAQHADGQVALVG